MPLLGGPNTRAHQPERMKETLMKGKGLKMMPTATLPANKKNKTKKAIKAGRRA